VDGHAGAWGRAHLLVDVGCLGMMGAVLLCGLGIVWAVDVSIQAITLLTSMLQLVLRYAGMVGHKMMGLVSGARACAGAGAHKLVSGLRSGVRHVWGGGAGADSQHRTTSAGSKVSASSAPSAGPMPILMLVASGLTLVIGGLLGVVHG
jgi:hypothetical protein